MRTEKYECGRKGGMNKTGKKEEFGNKDFTVTR